MLEMIFWTFLKNASIFLEIFEQFVRLYQNFEHEWVEIEKTLSLTRCRVSHLMYTRIYIGLKRTSPSLDTTWYVLIKDQSSQKPHEHSTLHPIWHYPAMVFLVISLSNVNLFHWNWLNILSIAILMNNEPFCWCNNFDFVNFFMDCGKI